MSGEKIPRSKLQGIPSSGQFKFDLGQQEKRSRRLR